ncbi:glycosyltransferase [uncultured Clostridium sp.]|jgi:glycosyltransferase involved in cell wall biosynthesis|uniref:glycosyltransferase family 2 protein n=1 Tax=uncultured Clostridium sp. TaxID=59620 RepID=UPI00261FCF5D|nr:glycosyltransferase [uncultured Clostridium sp.]
MLLSIVVPVYNVESYLDNCIKSILSESKEYEVLLINDGSTDRSKGICEKYEKKFSQIKLINKMNGGLSSARNEGVKNANGKYILFLDSDDYLLTNSIDQIIETINLKDIDVFMSDYYEICDEVEVGQVKFDINKNQKINDIKKQIFFSPECIWTAWKFIVKKEFLTQNNIIFKEGYLHEDVDYTTRIILNMNSFDYMNLKWYCYRISRLGSIMNSRKIKSTIHTAKIIIDLEEYIRKSKYNEEFYSIVMKRLSKVFFTTIRYSINSDSEQLKKLSNMIKDNKFLLKDSTELKHKIFYIIQNTVGFERVIHILKKVKTRGA